MKLYDMKQAPNPRRVRIFLAEKGIEIPSQQIDIGAGENLKAPFLAINPRGTLPTLQFDDGSIIDESIAICRYFEMSQPEPNLMGRDAMEAAIIECWQRQMEFDGIMSVASIFRNTAPNFAKRARPGSGPDTPQIPALAERGSILLSAFYESLNTRLGETEFIAGDRYTIADITAFVTVDFAKWVKMRVPEAHSNTQRWYDAISARPSSTA